MTVRGCVTARDRQRPRRGRYPIYGLQTFRPFLLAYAAFHIAISSASPPHTLSARPCPQSCCLREARAPVLTGGHAFVQSSNAHLQWLCLPWKAESILCCSGHKSKSVVQRAGQTGCADRQHTLGLIISPCCSGSRNERAKWRRPGLCESKGSLLHPVV